MELARLAQLDDAYRIAGEGDERLAAGRHDEASALFREPASSRPSPTSCASGPALAPPRSGTWRRRSRDVRAAIEVHPGWLELLRRLTPEVAPSAPGVLAALDGHLP